MTYCQACQADPVNLILMIRALTPHLPLADQLNKCLVLCKLLTPN